jgi:hypothetical protein
MNSQQLESLVGFPASQNSKIKITNHESLEDRKSRLLRELEEVQSEEILTEKQKEEAEMQAKIEAEKNQIYEFFQAHFGGNWDTNPHLIPENDFKEIIREEISKINFVAGENMTTLISEADSTLPAESVSTPNALKSLYSIIGVGVAIFVALMFALSGDGNTSSSMQNMFNAFPLRFLINVLLVASSLGIAFCYCYFFHPEVWGYFHSKIKTQCSPQQDWNASPPQFRLQFLSDLFWKWALLFILAFLVIFV